MPPAIAKYNDAQEPSAKEVCHGADFDESALNVVGKRFKDASIFYREASAVETAPLRRWLKKAKAVQWDYKNIGRRRGQLLRLK